MKRILISSLILCACGHSISATAAASLDNKRIYYSAAIGDMFFRKSGENTLNTGAGWPDDHYSGNGISDVPYGFLEVGYQWQRAQNWLPAYNLGLRAALVSAASASGYIDQYIMSGFRNYRYSYDVALLNFVGILKADLYRWRKLMPYVAVGAGFSNYFTSDYTEQATAGVTPRVSPAFGSDTGVNFTYQFGVGLDFEVKDNMTLNLEANYADYGTVYTGKGANYTTLTGTNYDNESLRNKLSATSVFLGLTYYPA